MGLKQAVPGPAVTIYSHCPSWGLAVSGAQHEPAFPENHYMTRDNGEKIAANFCRRCGAFFAFITVKE